jgi:hypothetical protein
MFPIDEKPGRHRSVAAWRALQKSYRIQLPPVSERMRDARSLRVVAEPWQTLDVGPWAKLAFSAAFLCPLVYPPAFALAFPLGSMLALIFGISHVHRHLDEEPVWAVTALPARAPEDSPYQAWVREAQETQRSIELTMIGLPRGLRKALSPLREQSEDSVHSLQRLALRARHYDAYLCSDSTAALRERVARLREQFEQAKDPVVREHLRQADLSLQSALRDQDEMRTQLERTTAQAAEYNARLHHVLSLLVKQRLSGTEGSWRDCQAAAERLKALSHQIDAVEQVFSVDPFPEPDEE